MRCAGVACSLWSGSSAVVRCAADWIAQRVIGGDDLLQAYVGVSARGCGMARVRVVLSDEAAEGILQVRVRSPGSEAEDPVQVGELPPVRSHGIGHRAHHLRLLEHRELWTVVMRRPAHVVVVLGRTSGRKGAAAGLRSQWRAAASPGQRISSIFGATHLLTGTRHGQVSVAPTPRRAALAAMRPSRRRETERDAGAARPPERSPRRPTSCRWTGLVEGWLVRRIPAGSDQGIELGPDEVVIAQREIKEGIGVLEQLVCRHTFSPH
jgi:hypothetical protein